MLFNSGSFSSFLPGSCCFTGWCATTCARAIFLIVAASYLFYGWWDYRFLGLILFSSVLDYFVGLGIARQTDARRRKLWLTLSIVANLGILGFFKYFDFFATSLADLFQKLGIPFHTSTLRIILPGWDFVLHVPRQ
jgi:D-alanyl-lipoteichoic acid acyltransferase DltB (MBOAT superfamily)